MKFEIFNGRDLKPRFRLRANNGKILCQSESYSNVGGARKCIRAIKTCASAVIVDLRKLGR